MVTTDDLVHVFRENASLSVSIVQVLETDLLGHPSVKSIKQ